MIQKANSAIKVVKAKVVKSGPQKQQKKTASSFNLSKRARNIGLTTAAIGFTYISTRSIIRMTNRSYAESRITTDIHVQYASMFRQAMNPSGSRLFKNWDGTKEELMYKIAKEVDDFKKVAKQYKRLYSTVFKKANLLKDVQKELNNNEYAIFLNYINTTGAFLPTEYSEHDYGAEKMLVIITKDTRMWQVPYYNKHALLKKGHVLNKTMTTGRVLYSDEGFLQPKEKFYHIRAYAKDSGKLHSAVLKADDIMLINLEQLKKYKKDGSIKLYSFQEEDFE